MFVKRKVLVSFDCIASENICLYMLNCSFVLVPNDDAMITAGQQKMKVCLDCMRDNGEKAASYHLKSKRVKFDNTAVRRVAPLLLLFPHLTTLIFSTLVFYPFSTPTPTPTAHHRYNSSHYGAINTRKINNTSFWMDFTNVNITNPLSSLQNLTLLLLLPTHYFFSGTQLYFRTAEGIMVLYTMYRSTRTQVSMASEPWRLWC